MSEWEELERSRVRRSNDPMVIALRKAISNQETIEIIYEGGDRPGDSRSIRPKTLYRVEGSDVVYLDAYCHTRQEIRCFRVDKIVIPGRSANRPMRRMASKGSIDQSILRIVNANPGQKSKDIAKQLRVNRKLVNSALYGRLVEARKEHLYRNAK